jgi:DNA polymerase III subunit delta'
MASAAQYHTSVTASHPAVLREANVAFSNVQGQTAAIATLERALASGRVHHAYRFEGPPGVGKELAAFALAQALVCERGSGCGACSACHRAVTLSGDEPRVPLHPDVVLLGRGLYRGLLGSNSSEATGISVEQVRRIVLSRAGFPPHEGRALVFIVRDADEITPQAANALLKTLEEPHDRTHFVLLTSRPSRLIDTIRSRTLPVRFAPLSDRVVRALLEARGLDGSVAPLAQGSASLALELADPDEKRERDAFADAAFAALVASDLAPALKLAEGQKKGRDALKAQLAFFAQALAADAQSAVAGDPTRALTRAVQHRGVLEAIVDVERNVQPALALEAMFVRLRAG